jgi:hypothetical protein
MKWLLSNFKVVLKKDAAVNYFYTISLQIICW